MIRNREGRGRGFRARSFSSRWQSDFGWRHFHGQAAIIGSVKQAVSQSLIGRRFRGTRAAISSVLAVLCIFAILAGCSSVNIDNKEAVQAAMVDYLKTTSSSTGLDPDAMDVVINAVTFERETAHASVSFLVKGTDQGMNMNYTLRRDGDKWVVEGRQDATMPAHGFDAGEVDPGAEMPAGHPAVGGAGEEAGAQQ